jgi:hypothetical protein
MNARNAALKTLRTLPRVSGTEGVAAETATAGDGTEIRFPLRVLFPAPPRRMFYDLETAPLFERVAFSGTEKQIVKLT